MRFECNCTNEIEFKEMLDEIHNEKWGTSFEVGARLWFTPDGNSKTIMVEYQVTTKDCRELTENDGEPDWFTAYEVNDENDYDCSNEIYTEIIEDSLKLYDLKEVMGYFANMVSENYYSSVENA